MRISSHLFHRLQPANAENAPTLTVASTRCFIRHSEFLARRA